MAQDIRSGQISGSIADPTSVSIASASVTLLSLNQVLHTSSNSNGIFRFEDLVPGVYVIEISVPGFAKKTIPVTIQPDHVQENVSVVMNVGNMPDMEECGRHVSITYEDADNTRAELAGTLRNYFGRKPIARAEIKISSESGRAAPVIVQSDASGRFAVRYLAPDYYDIQITSKGFEEEVLKHVAKPRENRIVVESTLRRRRQMVVCQ